MAKWKDLRQGDRREFSFLKIDVVGHSELTRKYKEKDADQTFSNLSAYVKEKIKRYNGRVWNWAGDGGLCAFYEWDITEDGVFAALSIARELIIFNKRGNLLPEDIRIRIALHKGNAVYKKDSGDITSRAINFVAKLEAQATQANEISISEDVFNDLSTESRKLFSLTKEFQGKQIYTFREESKAPQSSPVVQKPKISPPQVSIKEKDTQNLMKKAMDFTKRGRVDEAIKAFNRMLEQKIEDSTLREYIYYELGRSLFLKREYELLVSKLDEELRMSFSPRLSSLKGLAYIEMARYEEAVSALNKALGFIEGRGLVKGPVHMKILVNMSLLEWETIDSKGKLENAIRYINAALDIDSKNLTANNNKAYFLAEQGPSDLSEADRISKKTLQNNPQNPSLLHTRGFVLFKLGRLPEAERFARASLQRDPNLASAWLTLGRLSKKNKKFLEVYAFFTMVKVISKYRVRVVREAEKELRAY